MANPTPRTASYKLSDSLTVHALFDGGLAGVLGDYHNLPAATLRERLLDSGQEVPPRPDLSCFLIENGERRLLVDAGAGVDIGEGGGALIESLGLIGLEPYDVDAIFLTHLHGDHIGGLTTRDGKPRFPRAEILISSNELSYWLKQLPSAKAPRRVRQDAIIDHALSPYRGRVRAVEEGLLSDMVAVRSLPGHTPGHSGLIVGGESPRRLLILGDILHLPEVQLPHPEVTTAYDWNETLAAATRQQALAESERDDIVVAGMHFRWPTFSRVRSVRGRFVLVSAKDVTQTSEC